MEYDWSDAWLQEAAGWKAVKDGRILYSRGLVQSAQWLDGVCHGTIAGGKLRRVKVQRLSASLAEAQCGCPENQRTGAICEHAVAVILAARDGSEKKSIRATTSQKLDPVSDVKAYRVRWYPSWEREWKQHRVTVSVEPSDRVNDEADEIFHHWVVRQGLNRKPAPWILVLQGEGFEDFLKVLSGHSEIICEKQTIVCNSEAPLIRVRSKVDADHWTFTLVDCPGEFLGAKKNPWWRLNQRLFEISSTEDQNLLFQLFAEKKIQITHCEFFLSDLMRRFFVAESDSDDLSKWRLTPVAPRWRLHVDGSLRQLRLTIQKVYQVGDRMWVAKLEENPGFLCQISNECFYSSVGNDALLRASLSDHGWTWRKDRGEWQLSDENEILQLLSEGGGILAQEEQEWMWSDPLETIRSRWIIVKPQMQVTKLEGDCSILRLGFVTEQGKALDADRIQSLLQSGKRLFQTNDGKTLVLPQESWEVFQRSVSDLHLVQKKGEYLAKNCQQLAVESLREYFDKSLIVNDLESDHNLVYPLINATLRGYQSRGVEWLQKRLSKYGFALLADEMGLGKTLQTIALLSLFARPDQPALVVVPTSLLNNWRLELERFAPSLKVLVIHGSKRESLHESMDHHVIVTSYGILVNDRALFLKREHSLLVLDEASAIRNPDTEVARCCFRMKAKFKLALTGTPLENHLRDLWSIFQFLQPGYLGDRDSFRNTYELDRSVGAPVLQSLRFRVMPFMLRRTKEEVARDLPAKIEADDWCDLSVEQAQLYRTVWEEGMERVEALTQQSESAGRMSLLTLLLRLRQICCDAALIAPELAHSWTLAQRSRKMERMFELLQGAMDSGRKMLVFSQFAQQLRLIEKECQDRGVATLLLDGSTQNRQELVDRFQQSDESSLFLISLKAGGYGLNLTRASTVVHFDPWWNPAAERQASDRAHRIGQTQTVNVYRLLTRDTVEECVKKLQEEKSHLMDQLIGGLPSSGGAGAMPSMSQIRDLLQNRD